jgi:hypothetical protein
MDQQYGLWIAANLPRKNQTNQQKSVISGAPEAGLGIHLVLCSGVVGGYMNGMDSKLVPKPVKNYCKAAK